MRSRYQCQRLGILTNPTIHRITACYPVLSYAHQSCRGLGRVNPSPEHFPGGRNLWSSQGPERSSPCNHFIAKLTSDSRFKRRAQLLLRRKWLSYDILYGCLFMKIDEFFKKCLSLCSYFSGLLPNRGEVVFTPVSGWRARDRDYLLEQVGGIHGF